MSSRPRTALRDVLESIGYQLEKHLVASGRAQDLSAPDSEAARVDRAETSSGKVLASIEKATVAQQIKWNERIDKQAKPHRDEHARLKSQYELLPDEPVNAEARKKLEEAMKPLKLAIDELEGKKVRLTHAVSAHGKGTDQMSRVLHGHRADERVTGEPSSVGNDPSNTSGAFTSNQGMLHTFNEAFAQADMVSHHSELQRAQGRTDPTLDQSRFATTIETGQELGYNLEARGVSEQTKGRPLAPGEVEHRKKSIVRTEGLRNATVVMDPGLLLDNDGNLVLDEDGEPKRLGWSIQTAFAHDGAPLAGSSYAHVGMVKGQAHEQQLELKQKAAKHDETKKALVETRKKLEAKYSTLQSAQARLAEWDVTIESGQAAVDAENLKVQAADTRLAELNDKFAGLEKLKAGAQEHLKTLLAKVALDGGALAAARDDIQALHDALGDLDGECYESGGFLDIGERTPIDGLDEQREVLERALALSSSLLAKADKAKALQGQKNQQARDAKTVLDQRRALDEDAAVIELKKQADEQEKTLKALHAEAFALRKATSERDAAHGAEHGPGSAPPAAEGYDTVAGEYTGDRPDKPPTLTGVDEDFDPLTAHHLYPWNKIKEDLNKALRGRSKSALEALFRFANFTPGDTFWDELAKEPAARNYSFASDINVAAQAICWSPRNIFMGPLGEKRADDPGEELDETFEADGQMTLNTRIARAMAAQGGIGARLDPKEIQADLAKPGFDQALKALVDSRKNEKDKEKRKVSQAEIEELMLQAMQAVPEEQVEEAERKRRAAAQEIRQLLDERDRLEKERTRVLQEKIVAFEAEQALLISRLNPQEVREDLQRAAGSSAKAVARSDVDREVARRQGLVRKLARMREMLAHAPKTYRRDDWTTDTEGQKAQKKGH